MRSFSLRGGGDRCGGHRSAYLAPRYCRSLLLTGRACRLACPVASTTEGTVFRLLDAEGSVYKGARHGPSPAAKQVLHADRAGAETGHYFCPRFRRRCESLVLFSTFALSAAQTGSGRRQRRKPSSHLPTVASDLILTSA